MVNIIQNYTTQLATYFNNLRKVDIKAMFNDWNKFEILWLMSSVCVLAIVNYKMADSHIALNFVATITGIINLILIAKGKILNYFFAFVSNLTYAYVCYLDGIYGQALLFTCFFFPMQFYGLYCWTKPGSIDQNSDIITKSLSMMQRLSLIMVIAIMAMLYGYFILDGYFGQKTGLIADSITGVVSVVAFFLMVKAYVEQWVLWIVVNSLTTIIWIQQYMTGEDAGGIAFLVMWLIYLLNAIYGFINWRKLSK